MYIDEYLDMLTEDYFEFKRDLLIEGIEWDILDEEEKSQGIFARIKSMVDSILNWFKTTWENFVNKFKDIPIVKKASARINSLIAKIKKLFGRTNKNNAAENYEDIKDATEEVRDEANKATEEVKRRRKGNADTSGNAGKMNFKDKNADTRRVDKINFGESYADFRTDAKLKSRNGFVVVCRFEDGRNVREFLSIDDIRDNLFSELYNEVKNQLYSDVYNIGDKGEIKKFLSMVKRNYATGRNDFLRKLDGK